MVLNDFGQGCTLPQVTPFGPAVNISVSSLTCAPLSVTFHVWVEGGQNIPFFYMMLAR